jgi:hypothetical protein
MVPASTSTLPGLEIAMNHLALSERNRPRRRPARTGRCDRDRQPRLVGIPVIGLPSTYSIGEIRQSSFVSIGIEQPGNVRMIQLRRISRSRWKRWTRSVLAASARRILMATFLWNA